MYFKLKLENHNNAWHSNNVWMSVLFLTSRKRCSNFTIIAQSGNLPPKLKLPLYYFSLAGSSSIFNSVETSLKAYP